MSIRTLIIAWAVVTLLVMMVLGITYDPTWSFGDVAQVVIAVAVVILLVPYQLWRRIHSLRMFLSATPYGHAHLSKSLQMGIGQHDILLRIQPTYGTEFSRIGLRFVNRRWLLSYRLWTWYDTDQDIIEVIKIQDEEAKEGAIISSHTFQDKSDGVGGRLAEYVPPYSRAIEDSLWLTATIEAKKPWQGHLSFMGTVIKEHRPYVRRSFEVVCKRKCNATS